jgi:hypothetical protein
LQLFAEGGNLVSGLSSKLSFHLTDKAGKGVQGQGYLMNEKNDTLASFVPYKFGMGHFNLKPENGTSYKVIFKLADGSTVSQPLPEISETGFTMQLEETENNKLQITVQSNGAASYIYLLVQTRQVVKAEQKHSMINGTAVFTIDKNLLGEGVSQFTVFDSGKRPVCERLFFLPPAAKSGRRLKMSKEQYGLRDMVEISLDSLSGGEANVSLSVYQLDELPAADHVNIDHYLWLTSELNGTVEQPAYYFSSASEEVKRATDYLMLTHGWRRFKWDAVLQPQATAKFPRERSGHLITGKVTDSDTKARARNVQVFLSVPASPQKLFTSVSDSNGLVQFEVKDYYGPGEIFVQTDRQLDSTHSIEILSPFSQTYATGSLSSLSLLPSYEGSLVNYSIGMQAQHLYLSDSIQRFFKPSLSDTFPFYGKTMYSYSLDDYVRFNTMEEVLREYVRDIGVGVKGRETSLRFKLFNEIDREYYTKDILVTVNGIPLFNADKIFLLDPLKIKQIDITPRNYVMGDIKFHGLANFSSYSNHYEGLELDPNALTIDYEGLQLQREFYSPDYSSELQRSNRLPDLRSTLYWAPNVNTGQVSFYTGDNRGRYLVLLQGVDKDGRPMSISSEIEVK